MGEGGIKTYMELPFIFYFECCLNYSPIELFVSLFVLSNTTCLKGWWALLRLSPLYPMVLGIIHYIPFNVINPDTKVRYRAVLPPKLYLVVFYQVILVNRTGLTCSDFKRPVGVLLGSACCTISHVHTPWGNCNKCSSMIVSVKDSIF